MPPHTQARSPAANTSQPDTSERVPETILSRDNRWIKQFRAAFSGESSPDRHGELVGVEGVRLLDTALASGVDIVAVLLCDAGMRHLSAFAPQIPSETRLLRTSDSIFAQLAATESPQGIAALVRAPNSTFDDLVGGSLPLIVVMAGLQDPGNVGTLVRAAEAFGATGIAACTANGIGTANPFAPKALRASAGSALRLPVVRGMNVPVLLAQLRIAGVRIYAACPAQESPDESLASPRQGGVGDAAQTSLAPWNADWRAPVALLLGNEGAGIPAEIVRSADAIVRIPQAVSCAAMGHMDSLNAAVAGAVLLYEAARQRGLS